MVDVNKQGGKPLVSDTVFELYFKFRVQVVARPQPQT